MTASYPVFKVVFNPDRADLAIGPASLWRRHHGPPPMLVYRESWRHSRRPRNAGAAFTVPRVPAGRYLVALYDGGEGGQHYSWEAFTVTGPAAPRETASRGRSPSSSAVPVAVAVLAAAAALALGYAAGARRRRSA